MVDTLRFFDCEREIIGQILFANLEGIPMNLALESDLIH